MFYSGNYVAFGVYISHPFCRCHSLEPSIIAIQSGTCAMKPRDQGGVVSDKLDVYGVRNLKVAGN